MSTINSKLSGVSLLLVDDDDSFRQTVEILLKSHNYKTTVAGGLKEALEQIKTYPFDLIITDLKMNDGSGIELLEKVRELGVPAEIIIMTAYGSVRNAVEAIRRGAYDYIAKPFKNDELLVLIEKALENRNIKVELSALREEIAWKYGFDNLVGESPAMKQLKNLAARVAATDISVLITGESGTGKGLLAKAIHFHSQRRKRKFVPIDCSAIPASLMESEFFGHIKGSFTSAYSNHKGLFEEADGGTVFLDEIGDMPLPLQAKILRVLQDSEIRPVGASVSKKVDVRIIAATNKNLAQMVSEENFRDDLYYRLNVLPIHIPPLRQRADDIALLVERFINQEKSRQNQANISISPPALARLVAHNWPGNVRELENTIKRAIALSPEGRIREEDIMFINSQGSMPREGKHRLITHQLTGTLEESLKERIHSALCANNWNFSKTATTLGIGRTTLWRKVKKYNITRDETVSVEQD